MINFFFLLWSYTEEAEGVLSFWAKVSYFGVIPLSEKKVLI